MSITLASRVRAFVRSEIVGFARKSSLRWITAAALAGATLTAGAQTVQHLPGPVTIHTASAVQAVPLTIRAAGAVAEIRVVTKGAASLDFAIAPGSTCNTIGYLVNQTCNVNITVTATAPGLRTGAVMLVDAAKQVLASQLVDVKANGALAVVRSGEIQDVAGTGTEWRYNVLDEGALATSARIYLPQGVVSDDTGLFYIADTINNRIRKVDAAGRITTYAGVGYNSVTGDGGPANLAGVSNPTGLALDGAGNLYIADSGNNAIRRIDAVSGVITTVAGQLTNSGYSGDGAAATSALLANPNGVVLDADGNLYIADTGNNAIRFVNVSTGKITTIAGGPTATGDDGGPALTASLNQPWSLAFSPAGLLYIADLSNNAVRQIDAAGIIHTVAGMKGAPGGLGGDTGPATNANLRGPAAISVDPAGNLYIADSANNRVRRVDALTGIIDTVVGTGQVSVLPNHYNADVVSLYGPYALDVDGRGNLYIADYFHNIIRKVLANSRILKYLPMRVSKTSDPVPVLVDNAGTATMTPTAPELDQTALDTGTTTCGTSLATIAAGKSCKLGVQFAPTQVSPVNDFTYGSVKFRSDAANDPDVISVYGQVLTVEPTQVALSSSKSPASLAQAVTFTAVVSETTGTSQTTGTVTFYDGTTALGAPVTMNSNGIATFTTSTLALGSHTIIAKYSGDASNAASQAQLTQSVLQATTINVSSSLNPSLVLQDVTLTAKIISSTPITSGTITFFDGAVSIGTGALDANSTATFTTHALSAATHQITAKFAGDTNSVASTSAVYQQVVNRTPSTTMIAVNPSTATVGASVTLTATVASQGGPLVTGTVTFRSGTVVLGTGNLDANGLASLTTTALAPGSNAINAVYAGDTSNLGSTSTSMTVTIGRLTTGTTLATNLSPANAGSVVQLTATVVMNQGQTAVGAISGTVTFYDGATVIGAQPVSNGSAVLPTNALRVGTHSLTATYSGATNYDVSTSAAITQVVQSSSTTTLLSLSASTVVAAKPLTLTATVNNAGVKATGNVTFTDGGTTLGTATLNAQAVAALTVSTLPVGSHNIVATYNGDTNYNVSSSTASPVTVTIGNTALTLNATPNRATAGDSVTLTPTLTTDGVLPANPSVTLLDNGVTLSTQTLNAQGTASFLTTTLAVGTHNITAQYGGNANNASAQSAAITVTIDAATTTTALSSNNTTANFGDTVVLNAAVASSKTGLTGSVTFQEGSTILGSSPVNSGGVATLSLSNLTAGTHTITAVYGGDSTHATSTSTVLTQMVVDPTTVSLRSNANPSIGGTAVVFTAQVTGVAANSGVTAAPTGSIIFRDGTTTLSTVPLANAVATFSTTSLSVGTHTITATYSGDGFYGGNGSPAVTQVIRNANSQTTLSSNANPAAYAAPIAMTVRVTGDGSVPTGTVSILDGATVIAQGPLAGDGTAVLSVSTLSPGIHSLTAAYAGDSNNGASGSSALSQQVQQSVSVTLGSNNNPALTLSTPILTATVRTQTGSVATGSIRFQDGTVLLGTAALNGGIATLTSNALIAGTHNLTATYSGDTANLQGSSSPLALLVSLRATQTTLTATAINAAATNGTISLVSVLKWDGPVSPTGITTFSTSSSVIGTSRVDASGLAALNVQASQITGKVTASFSGDTSYSPSESTPIDIGAVTPTSFTITLSTSAATVASKQYVVATATLQSMNSFSDTMSLGCLGLPYAATCTFDKDSVVLAADGKVTVKVTIDTGSPLTAGGQATAKVDQPTSGGMLAILPAGALLGLLLFGKRRKAIPVLMLLMLASLILPTVGCGTINMESTPAGTYKVAISAVGQKTGVTLSQPFTLTVTK
jgi:hypothetical protein